MTGDATPIVNGRRVRSVRITPSSQHCARRRAWTVVRRLLLCSESVAPSACYPFAVTYVIHHLVLPESAVMY